MPNGTNLSTRNTAILSVILAVISSGGIGTGLNFLYGKPSEFKALEEKFNQRFLALESENVLLKEGLENFHKNFDQKIYEINFNYLQQEALLKKIDSDNTKVVIGLGGLSNYINMYHGTDGRGRAPAIQ